MFDSDRRSEGLQQGGQLATWVALLAGWLILAWPWISGRYAIPYDAEAEFLPQLQFLAASLHRGDSPFWTQNIFSGHPQIADPQSLIFAPPYLALAAFDAAPTGWAMDVTLFVVILAGAAAMLQWTLDRGWHPAAGVAAALSFAFGAAMAWRIQHIGQVMSLAYLPVTLLLLDRALERRSAAYGAAAGVVAALLVLGRDQVALILVYLLIAYVIWRIVSTNGVRTAIAGAIRPLLAAAATGALIVTLPVMMSAMVTAQSNRPAIDLDGAGFGSLHPARLLTWFAADVFDASEMWGGHWGPPSGRWPAHLFLAQNMGQLYAGALVALLLVLGFVSGAAWRRDLKFFAVALVVVGLYALGRYTPVFGWMHALLPGVDLFRRPADAVFVLGFLASTLAAGVLDAILRGPAQTRKTVFLTAIVVTLAFLSMAYLANLFDAVGIAWRPIVIAAALMAVSAALLLWIRPLAARSATLTVAAVAIILTADLCWSNGPNASTALPPEMFDVLDPETKNDTIALLKAKTREGRSDVRRDRIELVGFGFHWPNASLTHDLENTLGYNPLRLALYSRATGAGDTASLPEHRTFTPLFPSYRSTLADLLGLRFIATSVPVADIDRKLAAGDLALVAKTKDGYVYENPRALPRVMFATASAEANFETMIETGVWANVNVAETVLLERPADTDKRRAGVIRIKSAGNTEVIVETDSPDGGFAILNDLWHPWWFATLDGVEVPIERANVLFRAVAVPGGKHTIRFSFEPLRGAFAGFTRP